MNERMRWVVMALVLIALVGVLIDPYTWHRTASDFLEPSPWWQVVLVLIDIALLGAVLRLTWTWRLRLTWPLLLGETGYNLVISVVFVQRDGIERFIWGIGAQEIVSRYLMLVVVRLAALYLLMRMYHKELRRGEVAPGA